MLARRVERPETGHLDGVFGRGAEEMRLRTVPRRAAPATLRRTASGLTLTETASPVTSPPAPRVVITEPSASRT